MNLEDIIKLASEAGLWLDSEGNITGGYQDSAVRFANLVAAAEREACAVVAETALASSSTRANRQDNWIASVKISLAIRARNKT